MLGVVGIEFFLDTVWGSEHELNVSIVYDMLAEISVAGLKTLVSKEFKTKSSTVEVGGGKGVSNPEGDVIESVEDTDLWSDSRLFVINHCVFVCK